VYDHFGCTEVKEVAWQCPQQSGYHINEDEIICEVLVDGNPAPPGEMGDIVVTDLHNRAMPLIRYRIGDQGMLTPDACSCGIKFSMMLPTGGRASDHILLPDGVMFSPYQFTTAIEKIPNLQQYQIVQKSREVLELHLIAPIAERARVHSAVLEKINAVVSGKMRVVVQFQEKLTIEENGKFRVVKNDCQ
jgi:phenylacetate-CoA ligase